MVFDSIHGTCISSLSVLKSGVKCQFLGWYFRCDVKLYYTRCYLCLFYKIKTYSKGTGNFTKNNNNNKRYTESYFLTLGVTGHIIFDPGGFI